MEQASTSDTPQTKRIGLLGEQLAVQFLEKNGYTVLERNYRAGHEEIDIIGRSEKYLVFFEVKTRSCLYPGASRYGRPSSAVRYGKQSHLLSAARTYLHTHPHTGLQPRMDVIEVYLGRAAPGVMPPVLKIHHIRNAFGA